MTPQWRRAFIGDFEVGASEKIPHKSIFPLGWTEHFPGDERVGIALENGPYWLLCYRHCLHRLEVEEIPGACLVMLCLVMLSSVWRILPLMYCIV